MTDPFIGEIRVFGFNFAPYGWATCDGQILSISQNTALFSIIGNFYGGDGRTNFSLPNLSGRIPLGQGQGGGLSPWQIGQVAGTETVTLLQTEMPAHNHLVQAQTIDQGDNRIPNSSLNLGAAQMYSDVAQSNAQLYPVTVTPSGGNLPHPNLMPYLTLSYCIALQGIYPPRG